MTQYTVEFAQSCVLQGRRPVNVVVDKEESAVEKLRTFFRGALVSTALDALRKELKLWEGADQFKPFDLWLKVTHKEGSRTDEAGIRRIIKVLVAHLTTLMLQELASSV